MENINLNHVVIFGYREKYYVNPNVTVYKNGMLIGMVAHLGRSQFEINEPCELAFNVRHQTITCKVNPGDQIQLSLNRWSGKLTAQLIENSNSHQEIIEKNKQQDSVGESGKSTAQLIENSNSHQEIIERNKQQDRKGVKKLVIFIVLMGIIVGACWIPSILDSLSSSSSSSSYSSSYPRSGYGSLGYKLAVAQAIEYYSDPYTVSEITKCIEVDANRLEYECTVLCPWAGIEYRGHGHLIQDGMGRNIKGKFYLDR